MQKEIRQSVTRGRGFTLVELILVVGTIGMVSGALVGVVGNSYKDFKAGSDRSTLLQDGQAVLDQMIRTLRQAKAFVAVSASTDQAGYITYTTADDVSEQFKLNTTGELEHGPSPGTLSALTGDVSSLTFTCYDTNGVALAGAVEPASIKSVHIAMTLTGTQNTVTLTGKVYLPIDHPIIEPDKPQIGSPVAWYKFDGNLNDSSGNGNNGTAKNFPATGPTYVKDMAGTDSKALHFDGTNDYVKVAGLTNPVNMTYTLWIKADSYGGSYNTLIEFANDNPYFGIRNTGLITLYNRVTSTNTISTGKWYHIAVTSDGNKSIIYINGKQDNTSTKANTAKGKGLGIGRHVEDTAFKGTMDDVRIYNRALSKAEIAAIALEWKEGALD